MITKEFIEEILGYEINDFKIEQSEYGVIDVYIVPKLGVQYINMNITISATGVEFKE